MQQLTALITAALTQSKVRLNLFDVLITKKYTFDVIIIFVSIIVYINR